MQKISEFLNMISPAHIYFSSGARNAPLLPVLKKFPISFGYQDQSLAFKALGHAKASNRPIIVCVTSGTAVAQTLPAMMEAFYTNTPLIVLSADRPISLADTFAPQTVDHRSILRGYARGFWDGESEAELKYPMHINLRIGEDEINSVNDYAGDISIDDKTLFLLSRFEAKSLDCLEPYLERFRPLVYQEVESPYYKKLLDNEILHDEVLQLLADKNLLKTIIRIGSTPNSKFWRRLKEWPHLRVLHLSPDNKPSSSLGEIINWNEREDFIKELPQHFRHKIEQSINIRPSFPIDSEPWHFERKLQTADDKESILFIGNSMPIRYLKFFKPKNLKIMANRGCNGIDGLVASAAGAANHYQEKNVYLFIGDLSLLYDFSTLMTNLPSNLIIIVFNNRGGRIFHKINAPNEVICEHDEDFEAHTKLLSSKDYNLQIVNVNQESTNLFWQQFTEQVKCSLG